MPASGTARSIAAPIVTLALGLALTSAGCSADGDMTPTPTPTVSPSPIPSPTPSPTPAEPTVPDRPPAMLTASADGAAAAASYFMDLYAYIYATGDTTTWRSMSAATCTFCEGAASDAETLAAAGKRGGAPVTIVSAEGLELKTGEWFKAKLQVIQPPTIETDASGNEVQTSEGGTFDVDFSLTWNGNWVIDSVGIEPATAA